MDTALLNDKDSPPLRIDESMSRDRGAVVHAHHRGEFWKPCPGTTAGYLCCGYQILTPMTGCGMYCRYCALHVYFDRECQVVFDNIDDLEREVVEKMARWSGVVRFGTGEFADSLFAEDRLGLSVKIARILEPYPNAVVEFKTKSVNVNTLDHIREPSRVVIGFSMNTPRMIELHERGTAPLAQRLAAARRCIDMGFWVAFHFDPMFPYPDGEEEYRGLVRMIFESLPDPRRIAWWSMGGFRSVPELKRHLRVRHEHLPLFSGEMILGEDRKLRYFRPIRAALYRAVREEVESAFPETPLYLCMESPELWRDAGMAQRIPQGLVRYLDRRAGEMLGSAFVGHQEPSAASSP